MREIKFRAWLNDSEQMVFSNDQASTDNCEVWIFYDGGLKVQVQETVWKEGGGETFERIEYVDCNHTIMQYTGLKDKNGKEIYEGDIVKCCRYIDSYSVSVVTYQRSMFRVIENAIGSTYLGQNGEDTLEIIGNIYENPELLNQNIKL